MEAKEKIICRLCLKICYDFTTINGDMKHVLDVLLPKIKLATVDKPVMCTNCMEVVIKCFDFKTTCFYTHDYIVPFVNNNENCIKLDLLDVYLSKTESGTGIPDDQDICAFCMSPVKKCFAISLDVEERDSVLENMIEHCVPELDLNSIKKPVICAPCHGCLEYCFRFVMDCLIVEEKIKKFCETQNINGTDQIELSRLLQFTIRDVTACEENKLADKEESSKLDNNKKLKKKNRAEEKIKMKTVERDFNRFEDGIVEGDLLKPRFKKTTNKNVSKRTVHQCESCSYRIKRKSNLTTHSLQHKDLSMVTVYKCDYCSYQSKRKCHLKDHLLRHKSPLEVTMYKCDFCTFETKRKYHVRRHMLAHKDPSEVRMHNCTVCSYQTRHAEDLKAHMMRHKDPSELTIHKCHSCLYQTHSKNSLTKHYLVHKNSSEVTMYQCDICSFRTKHKGNLKAHVQTHNDLSKATTYKCESCQFQTRYSNNLKTHMLIHKDPSEVNTYKCISCSFSTKQKSNLVQHVKIHKKKKKNLSEMRYRCDSCLFGTKYKASLKYHCRHRHKILLK